MIEMAVTTRSAALAAAAALLLAAPVRANPDPADWPAVLAEARGQTVYWHAWAGSARINDYIAWAARQVRARHGVRIEHVKLSDAAEAVSRIVAERAAGRHAGGAVDLVWLNGENFAALKDQGLLFGPWAEAIPNWRYVDTGNPAVTTDFTVPTDGLEAPWGLAQLVLYRDTARAPEAPGSMQELLAWARAHPGRFTFPQPPDHLGTTWLKQALYELTPDPAALLRPAAQADYDAATAPVWAFLAALTPHLWRSGAAYPQTGPRQIHLMADGEIDLAISFNPGEASAAIDNFELPDTVRTSVLDGGTIGNASFLAIPYNAAAKAGALVLADFLMSPAAQARKQDPAVWGNPTVLAVDRLPAEDRARFEALEPGIATPGPAELGDPLPEPHPSWMVRLEEDWIRRFGVSR